MYYLRIAIIYRVCIDNIEENLKNKLNDDNFEGKLFQRLPKQFVNKAHKGKSR